MIKASIIGATGYTGMVLTDLLAHHPEVRLGVLTSVSYVGRRVTEVFPELRVEGTYTAYNPEALDDTDVAFVCYPHAEAHEVAAELCGLGVRVIDLSADFRLRDAAAYSKWYSFEHKAASLLEEAVYGLPELYRDSVRKARLVANPGCYPTSVILALAPFAKDLAEEVVIADSKSGVSGAGRAATEKTHFCSVEENFRAYSEIGHRHTPEMVQELSRLAGRDIAVSFTPHLLPVDRGILTVCYARLRHDASYVRDQASLLSFMQDYYRGEPFVEVVAHAPSLREVQRTNYCRLTARIDADAGLVKVISVIDNLVKGASGQAVQNMNIMFGLPETMGLEAKV